MKKLDKNYTEKIKYIVLAASLIYISIYLIHGAFGIMGNMSNTASSIGAFFHKMFVILAPAVWGLVFAYLFDPIVQFFQIKYEAFEEKYLKEYKEKKETKRIEKLKSKGKEQVKEEPSPYKTRTAGTMILYLIIIGIIGILVSLIINSINFNTSNQSFGSYIMGVITETTNEFNNMSETIKTKLSEFGVNEYFAAIVDSILNWVKSLLLSLVGAVGSIASGLFTSFLGFVMGFYMLRDKDFFKKKTLYLMDTFIPERAEKNILSCFSTIHQVMSGYIRGQLMDACIYGTLVAIGLSILGVQFAPIIGLISGFCNLIPYVGAFVAFTLSISVALLSGDPMLAVYAAVLIFALQQLDSIIINPKCVSSKIDISAFLVIFALAVGGSLWGVFGMLFAVPIAGILKIFLGNFVDKQAKSHRIKNKLTKKEYDNVVE